MVNQDWCYGEGLRCDFRIVLEESDIEALVIRDLDQGGTTVTNDAEAVVQYLMERDQLWPERRLLYYDSEGILDEILWNEDGFVKFKVLTKKRIRIW